MKKWLLICVAVMVVSSVNAQIFDEWFRQKKTQRKYLLQQIAALKVYGDFLKKGWKISQNGLNLIQDFTGGEFKLHQTFFKTLTVVSPYIKSYPRISEVVRLQYEVKNIPKEDIIFLERQQLLSQNEIAEIQSVYNKVEVDSDRILSELSEVCSNGNIELTDDQRKARIDVLYDESFAQYSFVKQYGEEACFLVEQRKREKLIIEATKKVSKY
jgi:hypothetical protein